MSTRFVPEVGHWYAHRDKGQMFQVVAIDEHAGVIDIQDLDGDVDEIELDSWRAMSLDRAEAPEDSNGPIDDVEADNLGYGSDAESAGRDLRIPIEELRALPADADDAEDEEALNR
jgi:Family of unknown function (DUF6763)